jgi:hypothetical protein
VNSPMALLPVECMRPGMLASLAAAKRLAT